MDLRVYCYLLINCCFLVPLLVAKPFSLNKIIAEEKQTALRPPLKISESDTGIKELPKERKLFSTKLKRRKTSENIIPTANRQRIERISPLKYKKTFQIRAPLRPKKVKYLRKFRNRRKNSTTKREINNNGKYNRNYIPLLKNLNILFNNILSPDSSEDVDDSADNHEKQQSISGKDKCICTLKSQYEISESKQAEEAIASPTSISIKVPSKVKVATIVETTSTSPDNTFDDNISPIRRDKNISLLLARNTSSGWRNDNGISERSVATHYRNFEGHLTRHNGSYERNNTRGGKTISYTENNTDYPSSYSGNNASGNGSSRTIRRNRYTTSHTEDETPTTETDIFWASENYERNIYKPQGKDKFETGRNQTENGTVLSQLNSRLRGDLSQEEELYRKIKDSKERIFSVESNFTSNKQFPDGSGSVASENKDIRRKNKTITLDYNNSINLSNISRSNTHNNKQKIVVIYDGYSIARDVNGNNVITEKAYRIY